MKLFGGCNMNQDNFLSRVKKLQNEANKKIGKNEKPIFYGEFKIDDNLTNSVADIAKFKKDFMGLIGRLNTFTGLEEEKEEVLLDLSKKFYNAISNTGIIDVETLPLPQLITGPKDKKSGERAGLVQLFKEFIRKVRVNLLFLVKNMKTINENLSMKGDIETMSSKELRNYVIQLAGVESANDLVKKGLKDFLDDLETKDFLKTDEGIVIQFQSGSGCHINMDFSEVLEGFGFITQEISNNKEQVKNAKILIATCIKKSGKTVLPPKQIPPKRP